MRTLTTCLFTFFMAQCFWPPSENSVAFSFFSATLRDLCVKYCCKAIAKARAFLISSLLVYLRYKSVILYERHARWRVVPLGYLSCKSLMQGNSSKYFIFFSVVFYQLIQLMKLPHQHILSCVL